MSARWDQEPMTMNLKPIRDMRWDTDLTELARKLERKLDHSQRVNAALETQLLDARRHSAALEVALILAKKPRTKPKRTGRDNWGICLFTVAGAFVATCFFFGLPVVCSGLHQRVMEVLR